MTTMLDAMPEAKLLYAVAAVVVAGLMAWVAVVLKTTKEPWGRPPPEPLEPAFAGGGASDVPPLEPGEPLASTGLEAPPAPDAGVAPEPPPEAAKPEPPAVAEAPPAAKPGDVS